MKSGLSAAAVTSVTGTPIIFEIEILSEYFQKFRPHFRDIGDAAGLAAAGDFGGVNGCGGDARQHGGGRRRAGRVQDDLQGNTEISSQIGTKLHDGAVGQAVGGCYPRAVFSSMTLRPVHYAVMEYWSNRVK